MKNIRIYINNPNKVFTLGIHNESVMIFSIDEDEDGKTIFDERLVTRLTIGFLLFNIEINY
jgi:hypothetical protein